MNKTHLLRLTIVLFIFFEFSYLTSSIRARNNKYNINRDYNYLKIYIRKRSNFFRVTFAILNFDAELLKDKESLAITRSTVHVPVWNRRAAQNDRVTRCPSKGLKTRIKRPPPLRFMFTWSAVNIPTCCYRLYDLEKLPLFFFLLVSFIFARSPNTSSHNNIILNNQKPSPKAYILRRNFKIFMKMGQHINTYLVLPFSLLPRTTCFWKKKKKIRYTIITRPSV